ncbi:hypothetical protein KY346_06065 [Candidatus Woesearchaeota archaeon]|nr:hypothetical protein [Candidatus Woesearchaeota archaeon]
MAKLKTFGFAFSLRASGNLTQIKLNSGLASTEVKTENSNVVIFVKIIKENNNEMLRT